MANRGYPGFMDEATLYDPIGAQEFMVRMILNRNATATLVKVVKCTNSGGLSPVGFVDVQPLVNQVDGANQAMPHGVVYGLPYFRLQGGTNAVIIDPEPGDIGMAAFASHDISTVKATKKQANPGSSRRFDMADGMYFGGMLNGAPVQYVQFTAAGINVVSPTKVTVEAPNIEINAETSAAINSPNIVLNGNVSQGAGSYGGKSTWKGDMDTQGAITNNGKSIGSDHTHNSVQPGSGNSGDVN